MSRNALDPAELQAMTEVIVRCSRRSLDWFRRPLDVQNKNRSDQHRPDFDPVTEADRFVEDLLRAEIGERFPNHAILGEERGLTGEGPLQWIIDPIDGTRAFVSGQHTWGTLVGLLCDGVPIAGWMHAPVLGETFTAIDGVASFRDASGQRPAATRSQVALEDAIVLCTHPSMFQTTSEIDAFARVAERVRLTRYGGDCINYGLVAAGFADVVIENQLQPYDILPLVPIVEAAGGRVTDLDGNVPLRGGFVIASANHSLHVAILDLLSS